MALVGLSPTHPVASGRDAAILDRVRDILLRVLGPGRTSVYLFGSWASAGRRRTSDIDLAIDAVEPLPRATLARLREAFEESTVPCRIDVVDLAEADDTFRERVRCTGTLWIDSKSA